MPTAEKPKVVLWRTGTCCIGLGFLCPHDIKAVELRVGELPQREASRQARVARTFAAVVKASSSSKEVNALDVTLPDPLHGHASRDALRCELCPWQ